MTHQFTISNHRRDAALSIFSAADATDATALANEMTTQGVTGHIRMLGASVAAPKFQAEKLAAMLIARGWTRA